MRDRLRNSLFRGIRADTGLWIYGGFHIWERRQLCPVGDSLKEDEELFMIVRNSDEDFNMPRDVEIVQVIPETVGEYSMYRDVNNKLIFEGDRIEFSDTGEDGFEYKEGFDFVNSAVVVFNNGRFELTNFLSENSNVYWNMKHDHEEFVNVFCTCTVIGNIHEKFERKLV